MKSHLKGMVVAAAAVLVVALAAGVRPGAALAPALACPLMMIAMMVWMHRRGHTGQPHHGAHDVTADAPVTSPPHSAAPGAR